MQILNPLVLVGSVLIAPAPALPASRDEVVRAEQRKEESFRKLTRLKELLATINPSKRV